MGASGRRSAALSLRKGLVPSDLPPANASPIFHPSVASCKRLPRKGCTVFQKGIIISCCCWYRIRQQQQQIPATPCRGSVARNCVEATVDIFAGQADGVTILRGRPNSETRCLPRKAAARGIGHAAAVPSSSRSARLRRSTTSFDSCRFGRRQYIDRGQDRSLRRRGNFVLSWIDDGCRAHADGTRPTGGEAQEGCRCYRLGQCPGDWDFAQPSSNREGVFDGRRQQCPIYFIVVVVIIIVVVPRFAQCGRCPQAGGGADRRLQACSEGDCNESCRGDPGSAFS